MSKIELLGALQEECNGQATLDELVNAYKYRHFPISIYGENYVDNDEIKTNLHKYTNSLLKEGVFRREFRRFKNIRKRKIPYYIQLKQRVSDDVVKVLEDMLSDLV